jgi:hypothetical protein
MDLIKDKFNEIEDAMQAKFNGYEKDTGRRISNNFNTGFAIAYRRSSEELGRQ